MDTPPPHPTPLVAFILEALEARGWSQRRLAEVADLSHGALSRVLRGIATPETATVEKIADALEVPRLDLLRLLAAEPSNLVAAPERDPDVAYIAQRLGSLLPHTRARTIETIESLLAAVAVRRTRDEIHAEFIAIYREFSTHQVVLRGVKTKAEKEALMRELLPTMHRFRFLISDLYALPELSGEIAPPYLIREIQKQIDLIFLYIVFEGEFRRAVWEKTGRGIGTCLGRIVLLQGDLGHHILGEATANAVGMVSQYGNPNPLVDVIYKAMNKFIKAGQNKANLEL